jgi:predicted Zn-dependent peptidase
MFVIAAGHAKETELLKKTKIYFASARGDTVSKFEKARLGKHPPALRLYTKDTEQTHVALGLHALDRFHPDKYILSIINIILGANMSSRLFHIVRDEMALCYEISSSVRRYEDCGAFVVSAGVDDKKLLKALEVILTQIDRMKREPVSNDELRRAKEYYRGQLLFSLEDTMSHMLWLGEKIVSGERDFSVKTILNRIEAVTPDDLMRISNEVFTDDNLNLAIIGPIKDEANIKEALHLK